MAVQALDGSRHHSASRAKLHDEMAADKGKKPPMTKATPEAGGEPDGAEGHDVSHMPIHEVVEKHGPAHKVEIEHDHEAMSHKKTSHHGKHKHVSEHESAEEAHDHAKMAAGVAESPDEEEETPDQANENLADQGGGEEPENKIPGM